MLVVAHQADSSPGVLRTALEDLGFELTIRCPNRGDPLPSRFDAFAGTCVLGGPMSTGSDDRFPARRRELAWLERVLAGDRPVLGICLGAQLMARALGAAVERDPLGRTEVGYREVTPATEDDAWLDAPTHFYQWHRDVFELPSGAECFARGVDFPNQGFRYGSRILGLQFHPEITRATIERWTRNETRLRELGAPSREAQLADHLRHAGAARLWLERTIAALFRTVTSPG